MGDVDALLHLAKLLLKQNGPQVEALELLRRCIAAGPQVTYSLPVNGENSVLMPDEGFEQAQELVRQLTGN